MIVKAMYNKDDMNIVFYVQSKISNLRNISIQFGRYKVFLQ